MSTGERSTSATALTTTSKARLMRSEPGSTDAEGAVSSGTPARWRTSRRALDELAPVGDEVDVHVGLGQITDQLPLAVVVEWAGDDHAVQVERLDELEQLGRVGNDRHGADVPARPGIGPPRPRAPGAARASTARRRP